MTISDTLAKWLPAQRWYSGTAAIRDLAITSQTTLTAGDPELRHLIVTVPGNGGAPVRYQVVAGLRSQVPDWLRRAVIGPAGPGVTAYDALHDPALARVLLSGIAEQETVGRLHFAREPGARIDGGLDSLVLSGEQSNTSVVFGNSAILKVLRRIFPGEHPDLEVNRALARRGCAHVAEPLGWIETRGDDSDPALLAILSRYLPGSCEGWSLANASLSVLYAGNGGAGQTTREHAGKIGPDFAGEALALGVTTAEVHADLAAAFGTAQAGPDACEGLAGQMAARLDTAQDEVPELVRYTAAIRDCYASLADLRQPMPVQRIHGDYHLGQVLSTPLGATGDQRWVILDFEGEPSVPVGERRERGSPLRDVAGMLRSFDYAARHHLLDRQVIDGSGAGELQIKADEWVRRCQAAFCEGYATAGGPDPRSNPVLLRALMLDKAVYEVVYEARHRPSWLAIPLGAIARAI